jgi:glycosyltransferase involved in cell wall biosynthesis
LEESRVKVGVYAICRNEEANVEEWIAACSLADSITVCDTGSTDGTLEKLRACLLRACLSMRPAFRFTVHQISVSPWRFDVARNAALALVPHDADVCFPLDLDERLPADWRSLVESRWRVVAGETTKAFHTVQMWDLKCTAYPPFLQSKIHCRHGYVWRYPVHEGLYPDRIQELGIAIPELVVQTYHKPDQDRSSYLGLLELGLAENPDDRRMTHYLARELFYRGRYAEAIPLFHRYLGMQGPPHPWELTETMRLLARASELLRA